MKATEIMKMVNEAMTIDSMWSMKLWSKLADELESVGFKCTIKKGCSTSKNYIYQRRDCKYVLIIIESEQLGDGTVKPLIVDKKVYEEYLRGKSVYLNLSCNDKDLRPAVKLDTTKYGTTNYKVHRLAVNAPKGALVDHISHSGSVCTKDMLRIVTNEQNCLNKKFRSKVYPDLLMFEGVFTVPFIEQRNYFISKGYTFAKCKQADKYAIVSPKFESTEELYKALNIFEKSVIGEYRYNPILSCETNTSLYLYIKKCMLGMSEEDFRAAKIAELKLLGDDETMLYYGI